MGKKNLDKLFQEKLKDFSEIPDDKVWQSIETSLDQKKKSRKIIPIWWKLGGVAAILLVAVTLINPFEGESTTSPTVTEIDNDAKNPSTDTKVDGTLEHQNANENPIIDTRSEAITSKNEQFSSDPMANSGATADKGLISKGVSESSKNEGIKNQNDLGVQVANSDQKEQQNTMLQNEAKLPENTVGPTNGATQVAASVTSKSRLEETLPNEVGARKETRTRNAFDTSAEEGISAINQEDATENIQDESKKKSLFDEIAEQEQEEVIAEHSGSKWSAGPSIAPVYFNAIGEGSPVHSIFVPNSKSGDVNLSYGLSVAYEVNKKLSIRSGIHKVDYGYRTNDVEFSSSLENATSGQIDNIDYTLTSKNLVVGSKVSNRVEAFNQNPFLDTSSDVSAASAAREGTMEQQFGYLEVPIELNYALVNNRFGINLIGGVSSLFLVDNAISLNSGELTTEMGEANNVNSVNFSTNVGFGVNYKFTPKVRLNIEPVFKYQLNTFSETDGTFNPFSVGVYSGLSFKF